MIKNSLVTQLLDVHSLYQENQKKKKEKATVRYEYVAQNIQQCSWRSLYCVNTTSGLHSVCSLVPKVYLCMRKCLGTKTPA